MTQEGIITALKTESPLSRKELASRLQCTESSICHSLGGMIKHKEVVLCDYGYTQSNRAYERYTLNEVKR